MSEDEIELQKWKDVKAKYLASGNVMQKSIVVDGSTIFFRDIDYVNEQISRLQSRIDAANGNGGSIVRILCLP